MILSLVAGAIGVSLISSGTYAYFSDEVETTNTIESGTLELGLEEAEEDGVLFEFTDKKPGDTFDYAFELSNDGSLEIGELTLESDYTVTGDDVKDSLKGDFGSQIRINSLKADETELLPEKATLDEFEKMDILKDSILNPEDDVKIYVQFEFLKTDEKQNQYQGNAMELKWNFEALQAFDDE